LVQNLEKQLTTFNHQYCLEETVLSVEKQEDYIEVTTDKGIHYSKAVILALGNGSFQPRKLTLPESERFEGYGLDYFVTDLMKYAGRKVAIAGGGDSAIDWALMLEPIASEVYLIHRRPEFRAHEHSVSKLQASAVNILTPYVIQEIQGEQRLTGVSLQQVKGDETVSLSLDALIVNYGFSSTLNIKDWGMKSSRQGVFVSSDMSTSVPGIYGCGDVVLYDGKVDLIATGFGEAPTAVNNALHYIDPKTRTQPAHSTSLFKE
ncbi:NAD(P)/FAD-dependent oxidoreductase, partial [Listeria monocytogenes]|nr:NAD(P)/FAD-dependent oxidoreductase [Listeria monocytogenes]